MITINISTDDLMDLSVLCGDCKDDDTLMVKTEGGKKLMTNGILLFEIRMCPNCGNIIKMQRFERGGF